MEQNDQNKNHVNDKFFTYEAMNNLHNDLDNILSNFRIDEVILVPFKINFDCIYPFNTFLLSNDLINGLNFPYVNTSYANDSPEYFLSTINCFLYSLLFASNNSGFFTSLNSSTKLPGYKYDLDSFINTIEFKGLYIYENKVYAFIDLTKLEINTSLINKNSMCWFALLDEIINKKEICNIGINCEVSDFFLNNNTFIYFKDSKEKQIEIPSVVYSGTHEKKLYFNFMFGNSPCDNNAILGSGYYFTDYTNSFKQGGWSKDYKPEFKYGEKITENENENGKYIKGGIIRYALFLGNNLIKMNYPNDNIDESEIKKIKLFSIDNNEKSPEYIYEKMTLRVSDHDGLWKEANDSVYLGKLELDNGEFLKDTPIYVVKDYYSHTPLSYHYIDKSSLGITFSENNIYEIL